LQRLTTETSFAFVARMSEVKSGMDRSRHWSRISLRACGYAVADPVETPQGIV